VPQTQES
jgi:hypothetical protein